MNKSICILIGLTISGIILYPIFKKQREEQKAQEKELMKKVDDMTKKAIEEEIRHNEIMKEIAEKGEKDREEAMKKAREDHERISKIVKSGGLSMIMKYRDENGVIHEFDSGDFDEFRRVMKMKNTTLIFPTADDL